MNGEIINANAIWQFSIVHIFKNTLRIHADRMVRIKTCWSINGSTISQYCFILANNNINNVHSAHNVSKSIYIIYSNNNSYDARLEINKYFINIWLFSIRLNCIELLSDAHRSAPIRLDCTRALVFERRVHTSFYYITLSNVNGLISTLFTLCRISAKAKLIMPIMIYVINEQINLSKRNEKKKQ